MIFFLFQVSPQMADRLLSKMNDWRLRDYNEWVISKYLIHLRWFDLQTDWWIRSQTPLINSRQLAREFEKLISENPKGIVGSRGIVKIGRQAISKGGGQEEGWVDFGTRDFGLRNPRSNGSLPWDIYSPAFSFSLHSLHSVLLLSIFQTPFHASR